MRIVLQRVACARVEVGGQTIAAIRKGLLLLVGIGRGDGAVDLEKAARRLAELRVFEDGAGKMNLSLRDAGGEILAVSQFTLYGDTRKGRRPGFTDAAGPHVAEPIFDAFVQALRGEGIPVQTGRFGAKMSVKLVNDGPVTFVLEVAAGGEGG